MNLQEDTALSGSTLRPWPEVAKLIIVAIAYWVAVRLGLLLVAHPEGIASIWPASGLALAILLLSPKSQWAKLLAIIFITNATGNWVSGNSFPVSLGFALANMLEPFLGAYTLTYFFKSNISFSRTVEIFALLGVATLCNGVTALIGAAAPALAFNSPYFSTWRLWLASDGLGIILITPVLVAWATSRNVFKSWSPRLVVEAIVLVLILATFAWLLSGRFTHAEKPLLRNYMVFPLLIWLAFRFSQRAISSGLLLFTVITIWNTLQGYGYFGSAAQTMTERLASVQLFLIVTAFSGLFLNTMVIERKKLTEALRLDEERFRKMFEDHAAAKLLLDLTGAIIDANKAAAQFYGWTVEELKKMHIQQINTLPSEEIKNELSKAALSENFRFEFRHRRADGSIRDVEVFSNKIEISGKSILYSIIHDITERKQAEQALVRSEALYHDLVETSQDLIWQCDKEGRYIYLNAAWEHVFGYKIEEMLGKKFTDFQTPEIATRDQKEFERLLQGTSIKGLETIHIGESGNEIHLVFNAKFLTDEDMQVIGTRGTAYDITARKQAEKENLRLEALNRQFQKAESLSRMAGAIAHHFNNQLGGVIGNLEMAIEDLPNDTETVRMLTAAMEGAQKSVEISSLMLTYLGQKTGKHVPLDLAEICRQCLPLLQVITPLKVDLPSPGPTVNANANHIQQVLTNLVTNAWEAAPEKHGDVHLAINIVQPFDIPKQHRFPIDWHPKDNAYASLEVSDQGCGIPGVDIDNIFDPFFSSKFTGRGLGLPVVLGIVKAHGGSVTVRSEVGCGSTFNVFLPISTEEIPKQRDEIFQPFIKEGVGTVLLVEDEEMMREMARTMLMRLGFAVHLAKDGVEAVEVFRGHLDEINVVLCDLSMPRMNGWETLSVLRGIRPDIPVVLASGHDEFKTIAGDHLKIPNQVFLHKPYQKAALKEALAKAVERKPYPSSKQNADYPAARDISWQA